MAGATGASLKIGFIGCGRATATLHLPALRGVRGAEVVAVADLDRDRLQRVADRFRVPGRFGSWQELLAEANVDMVAVCTPAFTHAEVAVAALGKGLHVLVEKPLTLDPAEADGMVEAARAAGRFAGVGFNLRCHRLVLRARDLVRGGQLGEVELLRSTWTAPESPERAWPEWRFSREAGGGAINEVAIHHIDLWRFLLGEEVAEVQGLGASDSHQDHTVALSGRMESGTLVSSAFCQRTTARNDLEIFGREGSASLSLYRGDSLQLSRPRELEGGLGPRFSRMASRLQEVPNLVRSGLAGGEFLLSFRRQWEEVVGRVARGQAPVATFEDGRDALRVVRAAIRSVEEGRAVGVSEGGR